MERITSFSIAKLPFHDSDKPRRTDHEHSVTACNGESVMIEAASKCAHCDSEIGAAEECERGVIASYNGSMARIVVMRWICTDDRHDDESTTVGAGDGHKEHAFLSIVHKGMTYMLLKQLSTLQSIDGNNPLKSLLRRSRLLSLGERREVKRSGVDTLQPCGFNALRRCIIAGINSNAMRNDEDIVGCLVYESGRYHLQALHGR